MKTVLKSISIIAGIISTAAAVFLIFVYFEDITATVKKILPGKCSKRKHE